MQKVLWPGLNFRACVGFTVVFPQRNQTPLIDERSESGIGSLNLIMVGLRAYSLP